MMIRSGSITMSLFVLVMAAGCSSTRQPAPEEGSSKPKQSEGGAQLKVGEIAPTFRLKSIDGSEETDLAAFKGEKPVVLVFGGYTWPPFLRQVGEMESMYQDYRDVAAFRIVYIKEAHAADSKRPVPYATEGEIKQHKSYGDRCALAQKLVDDKELTIPAIVESMANEVDKSYHAAPTRAFLVRKDGRLSVAGERGPKGLAPALKEIKEWLKEYKSTGKEPDLH